MVRCLSINYVRKPIYTSNFVGPPKTTQLALKIFSPQPAVRGSWKCYRKTYFSEWSRFHILSTLNSASFALFSWDWAKKSLYQKRPMDRVRVVSSCYFVLTALCVLGRCWHIGNPSKLPVFNYSQTKFEAVIVNVIVNSRCQPLNDYYLGALLF